LQVALISIGKTVEKYLVNGIAEYEKRLKKYGSFTQVYLPTIKGKMSPNEVLVKEEQNFRKVLKPTDTVILLDNHGKAFHSIGFAKYLEKKMANSRGRICFLIGGAHGFSEAFHKEFKDKVSLSEMTFSHQIIRLIFAEQLYRAFTIINNEPYHNE
jgi:23S rRNA (pseudouridine1915-N3)-methyltransferase